MCYNDFNGPNGMLCTVSIKTCGGGLDSDISAEGVLKKCDGGVKVSYLTDGDRTEFFFKEGSAEYIRSGVQLIRMPFEEGKTTVCEIGFGNMKGSFEVRTREIVISSADSGYGVYLEYESGQYGEKVKLDFTVLYK